MARPPEPEVVGQVLAVPIAHISVANALERRGREVSENLWRKGLGPIERAAFLADLLAIKKQQAGVDPDLHGNAISVAVRWQKALAEESDDTLATIANAYGFTDKLAADIGLSSRTIRNDLLLYRRLLPDVVALLRGQPIAANAGQLRALAKLSPDDQRAAADLIVAGDCRSVSDAIAVLRQKPKPDPATKAWSAFFGGWARMSTAQRRDALRELAERGLPKGFTITGVGE